ncbi:MAG: tRNA (5-methylaminomethyl-2-thiouridine)(34)-methyltransferase MnmD [Eudoraea sp.]|nr:tRNA (5-methylaminomethyl-2-thiouridine)(34)-methyltransferase MnmD [Eudoraea sp.]
MKRKIITTGDGSKTIHIEDWDEQYHSKHGAINEAYHVFIDQGLSRINKSSVAILEIGFGTGLNALITAMEAKKRGLKIHYTAVEAYPITKDELEQLNYTEQLKAPLFQEIFNKMHACPWEENVLVSPGFTIHKQCKDFMDIADTDAYDLVYFDAFGARVQPELWTETIFRKMFKALKVHGILVTYAAKGSVRRAMQAVGFTVERLPGPPGKREMLRATVTID